MKRLFGAAALATVIALFPACGRDQPKATFNNRAPIVDMEKAVRMADEKPAKKELDQIVPTPVAPKKADDAGVNKTEVNAAPQQKKPEKETAATEEPKLHVVRGQLHLTYRPAPKIQ